LNSYKCSSFSSSFFLIAPNTVKIRGINQSITSIEAIEVLTPMPGVGAIVTVLGAMRKKLIAPNTVTIAPTPGIGVSTSIASILVID
jgi:hypothetical protein